MPRLRRAPSRAPISCAPERPIVEDPRRTKMPREGELSSELRIRARSRCDRRGALPKSGVETSSGTPRVKSSSATTPLLDSGGLAEELADDAAGSIAAADEGDRPSQAD